MSWIPVIVLASIGSIVFGRTTGFYVLVTIGFLIKFVIDNKQARAPHSHPTSGGSDEEASSTKQISEPASPASDTFAIAPPTNASPTDTTQPLPWNDSKPSPMSTAVVILLVGAILLFSVYTLTFKSSPATHETVAQRPVIQNPVDRMSTWTRDKCLADLPGTIAGQTPPPAVEGYCSQQWDDDALAKAANELRPILDLPSNSDNRTMYEAIKASSRPDLANYMLIYLCVPAVDLSESPTVGKVDTPTLTTLKRIRQSVTWSRVLTRQPTLPRQFTLTSHPDVVMVTDSTPLTLKEFSRARVESDRLDAWRLPKEFSHKGQIVDASERLRWAVLAFRIEQEQQEAALLRKEIVDELGGDSGLVPSPLDGTLYIIMGSNITLSCANEHESVAVYCARTQSVEVLARSPTESLKADDINVDHRLGLLAVPQLWHELAHAMYDFRDKSRVPFLAEAFATAEGEESVVAMRAGVVADTEDHQHAMTMFTKFTNILSGDSPPEGVPDLLSYAERYIATQPATEEQALLSCNYHRMPPDADYLVRQLSLQDHSFYAQEQSELKRAYAVGWALAQFGVNGRARSFGEKTDTRILWQVAAQILSNRSPTEQQKQQLTSTIAEINKLNEHYLKAKKIQCI